MEKIINRDLYSNNLFEFCKKVELNDALIEGLKSHRYFCDQINTVLKFPDDITRKVYILLEFTRLRSTCEEIIKLLKDSGQEEAAKELEKYNTSPGRIEVSTEIAIRVTQAKAEMKGTLYYPMTKKPRGKCIIINNEPKVFMESERFEHIFRELFFDVELYNNLTAERIRENLKLLAKNRTLFKHEALIVYILSHGEDEKVLGFDYKNKENIDDLIKISEIVDIFSEKNCPYLRQTPKMFFFNCCRIKSESKSVDISLSTDEPAVNMPLPPDRNTIELNLKPHEARVIIKLNTIDQEWINDNKDTFISYSCSEGYEAFYDPVIGISSFGQALSHSIAQYACEENLQSILSRTCDFMDKFVEECDRSAPEMRGQCMRRQLFFNPGFHK